MAERSSYPEGVPSWVDLMTTDPTAARGFYTRLLGWSYEIGTDPRTGYYTQALLDGKRVAGMSGQVQGGAPSLWTTYLAVDDVDKAAARVTENGGRVVLEPTDVGSSGRTAVAADPTGAGFGMWQAGAHAGAQLVNVPGTLIWTELSTPDLDAASRFYAEVFGYTYEDTSNPDGTKYRTFLVGGKPVGGMRPSPDEGMPAAWLVYFAVADTAVAAAVTAAAGGRVVAPPTDTPAGPISVLQDPQNAPFAVITPRNADA